MQTIKQHKMGHGSEKVEIHGAGHTLLCGWKTHLMLIFFWDRAVHALRWPCMTKDLRTEPLKKGALSWCG